MPETDAQCIDLDHLYWRDDDWLVHDTRPLRCGCKDPAMPEPHPVTARHPYDR